MPIRSPLTWLALVCLDCDTAVKPSNPFDPDAPSGVQAPASLSGTVVDAGGSGVEGAIVAVESDDAVAAAPVTSDARGTFDFGEISPGTYVVNVSHAAYSSLSRPLTVTPGEESMIELVLRGSGAGTASGEGRLETQLGLPSTAQDHLGAIVEVEGTGVRTVTNTAGPLMLASTRAPTASSSRRLTTP